MAAPDPESAIRTADKTSVVDTALGLLLDRLPLLGRLTLVWIALIGVIGVVAMRGLYADGSWSLVRILIDQDVHALVGTRGYAHLATQLPVVLAIKLGVRDLTVLTYVHSLGLILVPLSFWLAALYLLRLDRLFWPFVLLFAVVYLNTSVFAIGEFHVAYGLTGLAMAILARKGRLSLAGAAALVAIAVVLTKAYPALVFLGPMLAVWCLIRLRDCTAIDVQETDASSWQLDLVRTVVLAAALVFVMAAFLAFNRIEGAHGVGNSNLSGATDRSFLGDNRQLLLALAIGAAYMALMLLGRFRAVLVSGTVAALLAGLLLLDASNWANPGQYYAARAWVGGFMLVFGVAVLVARLMPAMVGERRRELRFLLVIIPLCLVLLLGVLDLRLSDKFHAYVGCFGDTVDSRSGLVPAREVGLPQGDCGPFDWGWTYPSLSLLLREDDTRAIILNSPSARFSPFDPRVSYPDLSKYYR